MLTEPEAMHIATCKAISIFGKQYLRDNYETMCRAYGSLDDNYRLFIGIKDSQDLPGRKATSKGWVVYCDILVSMKDGSVVAADYVLE